MWIGEVHGYIVDDCRSVALVFGCVNFTEIYTGLDLFVFSGNLGSDILDLRLISSWWWLNIWNSHVSYLSGLISIIRW